jgi:hypothetical protein
MVIMQCNALQRTVARETRTVAPQPTMTSSSAACGRRNIILPYRERTAKCTGNDTDNVKGNAQNGLAMVKGALGGVKL